MLNHAYIFLGSNINRDKNYLDALRRLKSLGRLVAVSSVYDTEPMGGEGGDFYNGAVLLDTPLNASELKRALRKIEAELGRVRTGDPNAPRTIDLDLVLFNRDRIDSNDLHVPDPLILERPFMAAALAELNPQYLYPSNGISLKQIAGHLMHGKRTTRGIKIDAPMTAKAKKIVGQVNKATKQYIGEVTHA